MKVYEKALFLKNSSSNIYDCFGSFCKIKDLSDLTAIFSSKDGVTTIPQRLDYENFSVLLNEETETTFWSISEALLSNMQKIEILLYQLLLQRCMMQQDFEMLEKYFELEDRRIDGIISPDEYGQEINRISPAVIDPIIKMINVQTMHNYICDELFHAEYRMIDGFNNQLLGMRSLAPEVTRGKEWRSISIYADNVAFCYQDALKAIYKVLDIFSRWFLYIRHYNNLGKKVSPAYFSSISREIGKLDEGTFKQRLENICSSLETLVLIRNEIIHNESMGRNRQVLFVGHGTDEVNGKNLFYSKMLFWDHDAHSIKRSNGSLGFFTQNLDTLTETKNYFVKTVELVVLCLEHFFYKIIDGLATMGVKKPFIWYGLNNIPQDFTIEEIKELYYSEYFLFNSRASDAMYIL